MNWVKAIGKGVDYFVEAIAPNRALRRRQSRLKMEMLAAYRGAERNRFRDSWLPSNSSADSALLRELNLLRERSRDLVRNDGLASNIVNTISINTIGAGFQVQSRPDAKRLGISESEAQRLADEAEDIWNNWIPEADAQDRLHFMDMLNLVERQIIENGDVLVVPVRFDEPGRFLPLAYEVIEADRLETPLEFSNKPNIRNGVELGERGQPIAYWVNKSHPGDRGLAGRTTKDKFVRYVAKNFRTGEPGAFHLFWTKRPRQTRGEPLFAPVISYFKDLADYLEAELVAARIQACFAVIFESNDPYGLSSGASTIEEKRRLQEVEPGLVWYANQGEKASMIQPNRPGTTFDPFVDKMFRLIGSSLGLPHELVMKDYSKTNYSSARAALLEARRFFKVRQHFYIRHMCQPIYQQVQMEGFVNGKFSGINLFQVDRRAFFKAAWIAPGWGWIDPTKEVAASKEAIASGLSTLADECASIGGKDWQEVAAQAKREQKFYDEHEIKGGPWDGDGAKANPQDPSEADQPEEPEGREVREEREEGEQPEEAGKRIHPAKWMLSDAKKNGNMVKA